MRPPIISRISAGIKPATVFTRNSITPINASIYGTSFFISMCTYYHSLVNFSTYLSKNVEQKFYQLFVNF